MTEQNGDKENKTPAENATENKSKDENAENNSADNSSEDQETLNKKKRLKEKETQNEQLDKALEIEERKAQDKTKMLRDKRSLRQNNNQDDDNYYQNDDDDDSSIKDNTFSAWNIFKKFHPEYREENDITGEKWENVNKRFKRMRPGQTVDEIVDTLEMIHTDISPKESVDDKKIDNPVDIGGTNSDQQGSTNKPKSLTRKLNQYEQRAAEYYPGGEKAYREALADKELKGGITI